MADQGGDNIVIHTMRDDLAGGTPPAKPAPSQPPKFQAPVTPPASKPNPVAAAPAAVRGQFPLPPKPSEPKNPPPTFIPRRRRRFLPTLLLCVVVALGAGGAGAWYFLLRPVSLSEPTPTPATGVADIAAVIPAQATVVVQYNLASPDDRAALLTLWQSYDRPLLQGNPTTLLGSGSVSQFAYVMLEDNSRPFLLVPTSALPEAIASSVSQGQIQDVSGWAVLHALEAAPYATTLTAGTLKATPAAAALERARTSSPVQVYLSEATLNQLRSQIASPVFSAGRLPFLVLGASPTTSASALLVSGVVPHDSSPTPSQALIAHTDQTLLARIPGDATFARLGANLSEDVASWRAIANVLDASVLSAPNVATFIQQMSAPYVYYHRLGADGVVDTGLVATVPDTVTPPIALGDATVEQALSSLIPTITSVPPASTPRFADGLYQAVPLRFVNIAGPTIALDYTLRDKQLHVGTSKEGMFALLDTGSNSAPAFEAAAPWSTLLREWGPIPETRELTFGLIRHLPLLELLPTTEAALPFGLAADSATSGRTFTGALLLSTTLPPTP